LNPRRPSPAGFSRGGFTTRPDLTAAAGMYPPYPPPLARLGHPRFTRDSAFLLVFLNLTVDWLNVALQLSLPDFGRLRYVRELYDELSRSYCPLYYQESLVKYLQVTELIREVRTRMGSIKSFLVADLGCGIGVGLLVLLSARYVNYIVGIDISGESLRKAHELYVRFPNVEFVQCIMEMLPFRKASFDIVISVSSLDTDCEKNYVLQVRESSRVCKIAEIHVPVRGQVRVIYHLIEKEFKTHLEKCELTHHG